MKFDAKENKEFVTTCEEAHTASETKGKFTQIKNEIRVELADAKDEGNEAKVSELSEKLATLQKLPQYAQGIYDTLKENGHNQNVRYTAKMIEKDNVGKDGTVYAQKGDLEFKVTVKTGKDRSMIINVGQNEEGNLVTGYIKVEDKTITKEVAKADGGTFRVSEEIKIKDFTDREKAIYNLISPNAGKEKENKENSVDHTLAYNVKNEQVKNLRDAGYDVYIVLDKSKPRTYSINGEEHQGFKERISYAQVDGVDAISYTIASPREPKEGLKALPFSIESFIDVNGNALGVNKLEFTYDAESEKTNVVKTEISLSDLDESIANCFRQEEMPVFGKADVDVNKAKTSNFTR